MYEYKIGKDYKNQKEYKIKKPRLLRDYSLKELFRIIVSKSQAFYKVPPNGEYNKNVIKKDVENLFVE